MKKTLDEYLRSKVNEMESRGDFEIATDAVRAWIDVYNDNNPKDSCNNLTKREYFAAMMLQGLLAADTQAKIDYIAKWAVTAADILLSELEK